MIDLEKEMRDTVLRPLADKFQELTRQVDSGEYEKPKTIEEMMVIVEGYVTQAWERADALIGQHVLQSMADAVKVNNKLHDMIRYNAELVDLGARIDELEGIQLSYGHYVATTWKSGIGHTVESRLVDLQQARDALKKKPK